MKNYVLFLILLLLVWRVNGQATGVVNGTVRAAVDGLPLPGVNVIIKGTAVGTSTDANGHYTLAAQADDVLVFSFIGYALVEMMVGDQTQVDVVLEEDIATLGEVTIVSTGYQQLPKERANGSFAQVDQALLTRRVSTDILTRIEDVTSGVIFNRNVEGRKNDVTIRGMGTINSGAQPLIVVDNFPYDGDLNTINPNDVESITVLKDAAAASIWGARAGNGVVVITTKKGRNNQPMQVSLLANVTTGAKPDLFYNSRMSSRELIEVEQQLFDGGYYVPYETSWRHTALTPAVENMILHREGALSDGELQARLDQLGTQDVRKDFEQYWYRRSVNQQYALNLNGGTNTHRYFFSAGWDKNIDNLMGNGYDRVTLNANNTWSALQEKLTIQAGIYFSQSKTVANNDGHEAILFNGAYPLYPYARLKDDAGNHAAITKDFRLSFIEQAENEGLLNWDYVPLDELKLRSNTAQLSDYWLNGSVNYKLVEGVHAEVLGQYWQSTLVKEDLKKAGSYYARNLVNEFTDVSGAPAILRPVPTGGVLDAYHQDMHAYTVRTQLHVTKTWGVHDVHALAGYEVREQNTAGNAHRYYGYDETLATSQPVDYVNFYNQYHYAGFIAQIPHGDQHTALTDRFLSVYSNAAYTYKKRYTISGSARKDQSNLFGVNANQRGVPLWSAGLGWVISEEGFYNSAWLPYVKLRTTYGYNGNINKRVSAFTTAYRLGYDAITGLPYSVIANPPNPDLQWERVNIWNLGVDFEGRNKVVSGSIEFFVKQGRDLIGSTAYAPASGVTTFTGNTAATRGHGVDVVLNTMNVDRAVKWQTAFLFSTLREQVSEYDVKPSASALLLYGSGSLGLLAPAEGKPLYGIYSYKWAGLDSETGDPQVFLGGVRSSDYSAIVTQTQAENLKYHGAARPTAFGSVRNTVVWKNISVSLNISYRLGYYFRNRSVRYSEVLSGVVSHGDYRERWQQAGDEKNTDVPSMPDAINYNRDDVYAYASVLVAKGDHLRLQDVNVTYTLDKTVWSRLPVQRLQLYGYVNNVGILWKAADGKIDPDYPMQRPVRTVAVGVKVEF